MMRQPLLEQIQLCPPLHLTLQQLKLKDLGQLLAWILSVSRLSSRPSTRNLYRLLMSQSANGRSAADVGSHTAVCT